jgi:hypothetical protein
MYNIGSITAIRYAFIEDVASISTRDPNGIVEVTFESGKSFHDIAFTQESASFSEGEQHTDAGSFFPQELTLKVPKVSTAQFIELLSMRNHDFVVAVTDGNGTVILMGEQEAPARMTFRVLRPAPASGYNGYDLTFQAKCLEDAPFLAETEPAS